jgi:hypothetical protein
MRRKLSAAEFLHLALKEAEVPIVAAGRKPNSASFPSQGDGSSSNSELRSAPKHAVSSPKKRSVATYSN